ncbi:neuropeptide S, partial [Crotalus tigris]|uniref:neuropeptide S n=1 Tax=Crotalus tigris TaxID=88082 RepID=UPI00192FB4EF
LFRLYAVLIIWLSIMNMNGCYPIVASMMKSCLRDGITEKKAYNSNVTENGLYVKVPDLILGISWRYRERLLYLKAKLEIISIAIFIHMLEKCQWHIDMYMKKFRIRAKDVPLRSTRQISWKRNNSLYMNCQLPRKSDCLLLLLLNGCLAKMDGSEELALFNSFLENSDIKRSFRNGVGSGIKKISFRRAKS